MDSPAFVLSLAALLAALLLLNMNDRNGGSPSA